MAPKDTPSDAKNASQKSSGGEGAKIRKFGGTKFKFGQLILGKITKIVATRCHFKAGGVMVIDGWTPLDSCPFAPNPGDATDSAYACFKYEHDWPPVALLIAIISARAKIS